VNNFGTPPRLLRGKSLVVWIVIGLLLVALFNLFQTSSSQGPQSTLPFSEFLNDVNRGQVSDVTIRGNNISGHFTDSRAFTTYAPNDPNLVNRLTEKNVRISAAPGNESGASLFGVLIFWLPMFLLVGVWIFFMRRMSMRQMQGGDGRVMGFGKSRAPLVTDKPGIRCVRCGTDCPAGMKFCGQCGAPLLAACPSCGAGNPPEHEFCGQCGTPLDSPGPTESVDSKPDTAKPQTP
jgi:hypothetical protein